MAATTAAVIGATAALGGTAIAAKGLSAQQKAARDAANAKPATVDIGALQTQAQEIARQNAANSALLENQYNPGASALRSGGLQALLAQLNGTNPQLTDLTNRVYSQAGQPLTAYTYDSPLTRAAVERAQADLALGGELPQDVRNLVARQGLAKSGSVTGGLGLGRDIVARDLGLTSLQLQQQRLQNAANLGAAEAALEQGNAATRTQADLYGRNNLFTSADFLNQIATGDFQKALAAAQLGQNIAQPMSGIDPGSVGNLAVGNTNAINQQAQNAAALRAQAGSSLGAFGGQLAGSGLGLVANTYKAPAASVPTYSYSPSAPPLFTPSGSFNYTVGNYATTPAR